MARPQPQEDAREIQFLACYAVELLTSHHVTYLEWLSQTWSPTVIRACLGGEGSKCVTP